MNEKIDQMKFGNQCLDIDLDKWIEKFYKIYKDKSDDFKISGAFKGNTHYKFTLDDRISFAKDIPFIRDSKLQWFFEFFYATEPVGLHNDYLLTNMSNGDIIRDKIGILIPLEWNSKQPYTLFFDKFTEDSKLIFRKGEMRHHKTNEVYSYRHSDDIDKEIDFYQPIGSKNRRQYIDLKIVDIFTYKKNYSYVFDTRQWHSGSWFIDNLTGEPEEKKYKLIISGFGSEILNPKNRNKC